MQRVLENPMNNLLKISPASRRAGVFKTIHWMSGETKNFELQARERRYQFFEEVYQQLRRNSSSSSSSSSSPLIVVTAHNLDDSFEWWLLQNLKSGRVKSSLGIPLVRGHYLRPFLCVSKISAYAQQCASLSPMIPVTSI
jgi:tRNA(Ile)-lysidine synthase TilS/MesJ